VIEKLSIDDWTMQWAANKMVEAKINELVEAVNQLKATKNIPTTPMIAYDEENCVYNRVRCDSSGRLLLKCPDCQKDYEGELPTIK
jgi:hypothetical protein